MMAGQSALGLITKGLERVRHDRRLIATGWWVLFLFPFVVYLYVTVRYAINIPYYDDFGAVLGFMNDFLQADTLGDKFKHLYRQHNEHRIVFEKIIFLVQHFVFGEINFKYLVIFAKIGRVLTILVLLYIGKKTFNLPSIYILPLPYFLLTFPHWQNDAMGLIHSHWYIFFSILHLYLLAERKTTYACLLFPFALFTSGGGIILYPLGNLFLLVQKRWKDLLVYFLVSTLFVILYFYGYTSGGRPGIINQLINIEQTITYFFVFQGNIVFKSENIAFLLGLSAFILFIAFALQGTERERFLYLLAGFLVLTAAAAALSRSYIGISQALRERYSMYTQLAWVCIYLWMCVSVKKRFLARRLAFISLGVGVLFFFGMLLKYELSDHFAKQKAERLSGLVLVGQGEASNLAFLYPASRIQAATQRLRISERLGVYDGARAPYMIPEELDEASLTSNSAFLGRVGKFEGVADRASQSRAERFEGWYIYGWALIPDVDATASTISILLSDHSRTFKVRTFSRERRDVSRHYNKRHLYNASGYEAFIAAYAIPSGRYRVSILVEHRDRQALHRENLEVIVP